LLHSLELGIFARFTRASGEWALFARYQNLLLWLPWCDSFFLVKQRDKWNVKLDRCWQLYLLPPLEGHNLYYNVNVVVLHCKRWQMECTLIRDSAMLHLIFYNVWEYYCTHIISVLLDLTYGRILLIYSYWMLKAWINIELLLNTKVTYNSGWECCL